MINNIIMSTVRFNFLNRDGSMSVKKIDFNVTPQIRMIPSFDFNGAVVNKFKKIAKDKFTASF